MDDAPLPGDDSPVSPSFPRKQRLGRGLKHMLGQSIESEGGTAVEAAQPADADSATRDATKPGTATDHAGNMRIVHEPATPPATTTDAKTVEPSMNPSTSANVVEDAVSLFTSYDERFAALSGQLEAACNLLADQRQLEVRRARRSAHIGWSVVAALIILGMVGLWRAGETIGGQRTELRQVTTQASLLSTQVNDAELRISDMHQQLTSAADAQSQMSNELNDLRSALSKANLVIDQWMQRAHDVQDKKAAAKVE